MKNKVIAYTFYFLAVCAAIGYLISVFITKAPDSLLIIKAAVLFLAGQSANPNYKKK